MNAGATLNGTGTVGNTEINAGGKFAPGMANVPGTSMTVGGNLVFHSGSVYEVEVNAAGQGDRVIVSGTVDLTGSSLSVLAANGTYQPSTSYLIIDNDAVDPVIGTFTSVATNLAFLTPSVVYDGGTGNDVVLTLERDAALSFCSVAKTRNQCDVATALDQFPTDNALYLAVLNQTAAGARQAFDALSGEIHATVAGVLSEDSRYVRDAILGRLMQASYTGGGDMQVASLAAAGPQLASLDSSAMALGNPVAGGDTSLSAPAPSPLAFLDARLRRLGEFRLQRQRGDRKPQSRRLRVGHGRQYRRLLADWAGDRRVVLECGRGCAR